MKVISERNSTTTVKGEYFVTYTAERFGKKYQTVHLNPCGNNNPNSTITADELNNQWQARYKGKCPFNGDDNFQVVRIQQRFI